MLSKEEMFNKLVEQIQLDQGILNAPAFKGATVDGVTVHTQSHRYDFQITFDEILPYAIFNQFENALSSAFSAITW
jgi:DNA polymerase-3 subunit alpha (Gram-positive type)